MLSQHFAVNRLSLCVDRILVAFFL